MKHIKHWLATMAVLLCSITASAHNFEVGGIYYNITSSTNLTVAVTYRGASYDTYSDEYAGAVTIPETVMYNSITYHVTSIGERAFSGCSSLTSITIPESVTSIERYAFLNCSSLTSITIPEKSQLTSIGESAFYGCTGITSITIPDRVTSIGNYAFSGCSSLTSITIPEGVTSIGRYAFRDCSSLAFITLPENSQLTSIGNYAFSGCTGKLEVNCSIPSGSQDYDGAFYGSRFTEIIIGKSVTSIGDFAFYGCSSLTSITIPEKSQLTSIGRYAFYDCSSLAFITLPESVTSIGRYAFSGCTGKLEVNCSIPSGSQYDSGAFYGSKFTEISIGKSVTSIGDYAFRDCSSLTSITIPENSQLSSIGQEAFRDCRITSITIPESVTSIGSSAFEYCSNLEYFTINCSNVGRWFSGMSSIKEIVLGESVTSIGERAFFDCSNLTSITIPEKSQLTSIGNSAFYGCRSLTAVHINSLEAWCKISFGDNTSNPLCYAEKLYLNGELVTELVIPGSVTSIGSWAFYNCSRLTSITIPENSQLTNIGKNAFYGCSRLTSITIPENSQLTSIGVSAFYNCSNLTAVHINSLDAWCKISFGDNTSNPLCYAEKLYLNGELVTELVIPDGVTSIGKRAFSGCSSLTSITIPENSQLTSIGESAFYNCSSLTSITISENSQLTSIGVSAFYNCSNLASITIPENSQLTSIGGYAFSGCSSLASITIPESVTTIGYSAFSGCSSLTAVHINSIEAWCKISFGDNTSNPLYYAQELYLNGELVTELVIPGSVTSIGSWAFYNYIRLTSITIPENSQLTSIGVSAFECCFRLTSITIPESVTSIKYSAFSGCSSLTSITIPENSQLTSIGVSAFGYCRNLTSITIPENSQLTSIGESAFEYCSSLTSITIPESVTSIEYSAFYGCSSLSDAYFSSNPFIGSYAFPENTMKKLNLADNNSVDFNIANANNFASIIYHRDLASGKYGTIILPFAPDAESLENFAFYSLTSAENDMLIFDEVEAPQANTPYLFSLRGGKSATQITGGETTISSVITNPEEVNGWQMIGSFTNQTIATSEDADNYYYAYTSADNQLHKVTKKLNVKPYRAYFITDNANPTQLAVRTRNGETTLIDAAEVEDFVPAVYYDLSGRRVENPTKGMYIVNGKKVIL